MPILLVEDDAGARDALSDILRDEGFEVATVENGREALDYLQSSPAPCLILLDLVMPVMDGWEFRERQLREPRLSTIPVVVLTATAGQGVAGVATSDILRKPVDFGALLEHVERHCSSRPKPGAPA
jgi:CheY-like chemotaxis protein